MPVVAMTREMGSLGKDVAAQLSEESIRRVGLAGVEIPHHDHALAGVCGKPGGEQLGAPLA